METCNISVLLANAATVYIIASVFYLIVTRSFGTPFANALKKYPNLMNIKKASSVRRCRAFFIGILLAIIGLCIFRPFSSCGN